MIEGTPTVLYISDEAYDALIHRARIAGYVGNGYAAKGITKYIGWLMQQHLYDNRPQEVIDSDGEMRAVGIAPEWRYYSPRKRRNLTLTPTVLASASAHALRLGIAYTPSQRMTGAPTYLDGAQCLAAVLEAVGSDWIGVNLQ